MRILVYAHQMEIGGTQTNAIDLAASLRDLHGCKVAVFATPGPMVGYVREKDLEYIPAPFPKFYPSPSRIRSLREAVRRMKPDLIHVWDWWQCLDAYYGVHLPMGLPLVVSDMNMSLTRILPKFLPTTFGVPALVDEAKAAGRTRVELLLPPVDTSANAPNEPIAEGFRRLHAISPRDISIVTVSRLSENMKSESIAQTIQVVQDLGARLPIRLFLVGEGQARPRFAEQAEAVNLRLRRQAITLTGPMLDPRPAYAAADIVIGMGGSALRGMAFGKPVIVVGESGFSNSLTQETSGFFLYRGIFGQRGDESHSRPLALLIEELTSDPSLRQTLGEFARDFVMTNFSLDVLSARLLKFFKFAEADAPNRSSTFFDSLRTVAVYARERRFLTALRLEPPGGRSPAPSF